MNSIVYCRLRLARAVRTVAYVIVLAAFGLAPSAVPHIAKAIEAGIGVASPAAIRVIRS